MMAAWGMHVDFPPDVAGGIFFETGAAGYLLARMLAR
jgi:hypothetical protein